MINQNSWAIKYLRKPGKTLWTFENSMMRFTKAQIIERAKELDDFPYWQCIEFGKYSKHRLIEIIIDQLVAKVEEWENDIIRVPRPKASDINNVEETKEGYVVTYESGAVRRYSHERKVPKTVEKWLMNHRREETT